MAEYVVNGHTLVSFGVRIPRGATDETGWPAKTGMPCFYCHHTFEGAPRVLPLRYRPGPKVFEVCDCFCSWGCTRAYAERAVDGDGGRHLIDFFARTVFGYPARTPMHPSPDFKLLKRYGGKMTIEEFRAASGNCEATFKVHVGMMAPINCVVEVVETSEKRKRTRAEADADSIKRNAEDMAAATRAATRKVRRETAKETAFPPRPPPVSREAMPLPPPKRSTKDITSFLTARPAAPPPR